MGKHKNVLTLDQKVAVYEALKPVITKMPNDLCVYKDGLDDTKIARHLGAEYTPRNVESVRRSLFGALVTTGGIGHQSNAELNKRITEIEDYLTRQNPTWKQLTLREEIANMLDGED